jgi:DNA-nicking Smr family endonuclease
MQRHYTLLNKKMDKEKNNKKSERSVFKDAMRELKQIASSKHSKIKTNKLINDVMPENSLNKNISFDNLTHIDGNESLSYRTSGVRKKEMLRLKRGNIKINFEIDLHGLTQNEAHDKLESLITMHAREGLKCGIVIHGKGLRSENNEPKLKMLTNQILRSHHCVIAFNSATAKDGGAGAVYVLLKNLENNDNRY